MRPGLPAIRIGAVLFAAVCAAAVPSPAAAACTVTRLAELPVQMTRERAFLPARAAGVGMWMLLDTGSSVTVLEKQAVQRVGWSTEPPPWRSRTVFYGSGGQLALEQTVATELEVAGLRLDAGRYFVNTNGSLGTGALGVLGFDYLFRNDLELDLPASRVRIVEASDCSGAQHADWAQRADTVPLLGNTRETLMVPVAVNGVAMRAVVDSGSPSTVLSWKAARQLGLSPDHPDVRQVGTGSGADGKVSALYAHRFQSIEIGGEWIGNPVLGITDLFTTTYTPTGSNIARATLQADLLLGLDWLRTHRLYLSKAEQRAWFTYAGGTVFPMFRPEPRPGAGS